jgi:agmatinase
MSFTPTYAIPPTFMGVTRTDASAPYVIAGVPMDIGTTNRAGARDGPRAIRAASRMLVDGAHPHWWIDPAEMPIADIGDFQLSLGDIQKSLADIERQALPIEHLITLGGEHGVTLPLLRARKARTGMPCALLHFDAHVDTWPDNFGQSYAHGSVFYHALRESLIDPKHTIQIGIRSPVQREVWDWTVGQGVTIVTAQDVHHSGVTATVDRIIEVVGTLPCYLSFDIDVFDPAYAPGTGTPEIGGLATWQAQALIRAMERIRFIGMDVVEVAPAYDQAEITSLAAATMVWEYLCLIGRP